MKKLALTLLFSLAVLITVLVVRTAQFTKTIPPNTIAKVNIAIDEENATRRFAQSLTFATISNQNPQLANISALNELRSYLNENFPRVFNQLSVETVSDYSYLIEWRGTNKKLKPILLLSHMDVVPVIPGTESEWQHPPFAGIISDGYVWGRGAVDDKAGVLGILEAAETLLSQSFTPERTIYFAFGHDEEVGGLQGAVKIAELLEQREIAFEFVMDEGGIIVDGIVPGINAPVALIGPGEKGYLSLKLTATGTGGHSSQPPAYTAAGLIARAVYRLQENPFPMDLSYTSAFIQNLGRDIPFAQRMVFANTWLFEPIADKILPPIPALIAGTRTTTAPTMLKASVKDNVLPINAEAVINFRILPGETSHSVIAHVVKTIDDDQIKVEPYGFSSEPSTIASTDSYGYQQIKKTIHQVIDDKNIIIAPKLVIGATDARHFKNLTENSYRFMGVTLQGDEIKGFHGTNERVSVKSYLDAVKVYYQLIKNTTAAESASH